MVSSIFFTDLTADGWSIDGVKMTLVQIKNSILERLSIVELIGQTVALKRRGKRHVGLCPFHAEKTPSFNVFDDHYYCFGCRVSGDAINFVRKIQGTGFIETLHLLGEKCGVDTSPLSVGGKRGLSHKQLVETMSIAQTFFHQQIFSEDKGAVKAVDYLAKRGVEDSNIRHYRIGYAPATKNALRDHLVSNRVSLDTAVSLALLHRNGRDTWDFFSERIMLPIHNDRGQIVGFAGRDIAEKAQQVKYLNSRETQLFHKSRALFGIWHSAKAISEKKTALVVEGYFDWLTLQKAGIDNCVCCMGTALKESQLKLIKRYLNEVILIFDGDDAGVDASLAALKLAFAFPEIDIRVCQLPDKHDPDSYLREHGREKFDELLTQTHTVIDFAITNKLTKAKTIELPTIIHQEIVPILNRLDDNVHRGLLLNQVAQDSGLSLQDIDRLLKLPKDSKPQTTTTLKIYNWMRELLGHVYHAQPQELNIETLDNFAHEQLSLHPYLQVLWEDMITNLRDGKCNYQLNLLNNPQLPNEFPDKIVILLTELASERPAYHVKSRDEKIGILMKSHQHHLLKEKIDLLKQQLSRADYEHEMQLLREITALRELTDGKTEANPSPE